MLVLEKIEHVLKRDEQCAYLMKGCCVILGDKVAVVPERADKVCTGVSHDK